MSPTQPSDRGPRASIQISTGMINTITDESNRGFASDANRFTSGREEKTLFNAQLESRGGSRRTSNHPGKEEPKAARDGPDSSSDDALAQNG